MSPLITTAQQIALWTGATSAGLACWSLLSHLGDVIGQGATYDAQLWQFDQHRRMRLRYGNALFRGCEPFIRGIQNIVPQFPILGSTRVQSVVTRHLERGGQALPWRADEYLAFSLFQGLLVAVGVFLFGQQFMSVTHATLCAALAPVVIMAIAVQDLIKKSEERLAAIKRRLPFCIDLMALMMEAGADLGSSLRSVIESTPGTPVAEEFDRLLRDIAANKSMVHAFDDWRKRMSDAEIHELATAVIRGHEQGTPQSEIFLQMANQLRLRRTQWIEKRSGQLQTMMTFPSFVIMCAALLVILAPILISTAISWHVTGMDGGL